MFSLFLLRAMISLVFWLVVVLALLKFIFGRRAKYRWLQHQLPAWEEKNIISQEQGNSILGLYKLKRIRLKTKMDMAKALSLVGAIFLGLGLIFFIAANWRILTPFIKTALLLLVTISTLYAGYFYSEKKEGSGYLGKNLLLLASAFWGATVILISQIYNIPVSENWYIVLIWAFPIVPIAVFFNNSYVHTLASLLFLIWNFLYMSSAHISNYFYPAIVFLVMLPAAKTMTACRRFNIAALLLAAASSVFIQSDRLTLFIGLGLLAYYLLQKNERGYFYAASLTLIFWAISYYAKHQLKPNYYYLLPAGFILYETYKEKIKENLVIFLAGLLIWMNLLLTSFSQMQYYGFDIINFISFQALTGAILYIAGMYSKNNGLPFSDVYKVFGYLVAFICVYILSFRGVLESTTASENQVYSCGSFVMIATIGTFIAYAMLQRRYFKSRPDRLELAALLALFLGASLLSKYPQAIKANLIMINAALVIFAIVNIFLGVEIKKPGLFTVGIITFALFIITRYIDAGWRLKERSLFFIVGGLIILLLGTFLEKQRRKVIERMAGQ